MSCISGLLNILAINAKKNQFRENGKYCDVCIKIGERSFNCHRVVLAAASEYFDAMFGGHFRESKTDTIVLRNIDAALFEEILRFIYTGEVTITKDTVFNLLLASEFLTLVGLEEVCVQFIQSNLPMPEMFEMLSYASQMRKSALINVVCQYIMHNIDKHYTDPKFLKLSFDDLNALLSQHWYLSPRNEHKFLGIVTRWLNLRETKEVYFEKLNKKINFQVPIRCFSDNYLKYLLRRFTLKSTSENNCYGPPIEPSSIRTVSTPTSGLHVYTEGFDGITRVFSSSKNTPVWLGSCSMECKYDHIKSVGLGNHLYCLDYIDTMPTFRLCSTIDISSATKQLKTPPAVLMEFDLCNVRNTIYVNSSYEPTHNLKYGFHFRYSFSDEELNRGIYAYNTDIDEWFPLPSCKKFSYSSAITASDSLLFLVEGLTDPITPSTSNLSIQALDRRISKWQDLTKSHHNGIPLTFTCCAHEGKIYTCSGDKTSDTEFDVYDLTAGKWQKMKSLKQNCRTFRFLSYENLLWAFGRSDNYFINIETYNSFTQEWNPSPILGMIGEEYSAFMDVAIFKST